METTTLSPKKHGGARPGAGRRDQGMHEVVQVFMTADLKAWVQAQPGDASAFVRGLLEAERRRQRSPHDLW